MSLGFPRVERIGVSLAALATLALAFVLAAAATTAKANEPVPVRLFGSTENVNFDISPFPKWTGAMARYRGERHLEEAPCTGACPLQRWKSFVDGLRGQDRMHQLAAVNAYVNRTPYQTDASRFGAPDHWSTPREFLGRTGDCEDYAIAKYLSLRKLGWGAHELRIVVLKDEVKRELHAVLVAFHGGSAYVLDNLLPAVTDHAAIRNYRPIFSINEIAWHFHRGWNPDALVARAPSVPVPFAPAAVARPVPAATAPATAARPILVPAPPAPRVVRPRPGERRDGMAAIFSSAGPAR